MTFALPPLHAEYLRQAEHISCRSGVTNHFSFHVVWCSEVGSEGVHPHHVVVLGLISWSWPVLTWSLQTWQYSHMQCVNACRFAGHKPSLAMTMHGYNVSLRAPCFTARFASYSQRIFAVAQAVSAEARACLRALHSLDAVCRC